MLNRVSVGLSAAARAVGTVLPILLVDAAGIAGAGLIGYGAWLIFPPAGFITGGVLILAGVLATARR